MNTNDDFREQLVIAVAYRLVEQPRSPHDRKPDAEQARRMVRDAMKRGTGSEYWEPVSKAAVGLFSPVLGILFPILPQITSVVIQAVQAENQRGIAAERDLLLFKTGYDERDGDLLR